MSLIAIKNSLDRRAFLKGTGATSAAAADVGALRSKAAKNDDDEV